MLTYAEIKEGFESLGLTHVPVIAHASVKSFGEIDGGAKTLLRAILASFNGLIMPAFTYKTEIIPEIGPPSNALKYGDSGDKNKLAQPFHLDMPVDPTIGWLAETFRTYPSQTRPSAARTPHPILSFIGYNADEFLVTQTLYDPLAPIGALAEQDGWVLLLGVNHTVNTSIHYAEKLAGRKQFIRWALMPDRVVECPGYPGDSSGFQAIAPDLENETRAVTIGNAQVQAIPLKPMFEIVKGKLKREPLALLCEREDCERCNAVRGK